MRNPLRKVIPGDRLRIPASTYNGLVDLLRHDGIEQIGSGGNPKETIRPNITILIKNDTGGHLPSQSILGVYEPIGDADNNPLTFVRYPTFVGDDPTENSPICVTQTPLGNGDIGKAVISGVTLARVLVNNVNHVWVHRISGNHDYMETVDCGDARIISFLDSSGGVGSLEDTNTSDTINTELALIQLIQGCPPEEGSTEILYGSSNTIPAINVDNLSSSQVVYTTPTLGVGTYDFWVTIIGNMSSVNLREDFEQIVIDVSLRINQVGTTAFVGSRILDVMGPYTITRWINSVTFRGFIFLPSSGTIVLEVNGTITAFSPSTAFVSVGGGTINANGFPPATKVFWRKLSNTNLTGYP